MTRLLTASALVAFTFAAASAPVLAHEGAHSVHGLWLTEAGTGTVRIADCGPGPMAGTPCGVIETADIPEGEPTTDVNNADPALRDVPVIGLTMLDGFEADGHKWKKGRIYNPEDGKSYRSAIRLDRDDPDVLKVKGCIAFLCQTQEWTRVTD
ncbi:MAG: DUF2147 domain-containing protein [Pseudomonadota bacterium]